MNNILQVFLDRNKDWQIALIEHIKISLMALFLAILIALPLAIYLSYRKRQANVILQLAGILQTIPSLAILGILIPFLGIGKIPAIFTLTIYGLFPILQNTITGFWEIDPLLEEAATAFGMNRYEKLKKYQLAIAMPIIMSGVRTAAVMIIGTATLAALIGAGGLGSFILLGIDRNDSALILIGAVSTAILAVIVSGVLKRLETCKIKTIIVSFITMLVLLFGSFAVPFFQNSFSDKIVIASKLGSEPEILINMYKLLIEQDTDLVVELKPNFGKTAFLYEALKAKSIDLYPEFTGTITSSLLKEKPIVANDSVLVYDAAKKGIYQQDRLVLLPAMQFQNTYAVAVKKTYATQYNLTKISDLKKVESTARVGFTLEFNDRDDGYKGLKSLYNLNLNVVTMEPSLRYQALKQGAIDVIDAYSTDSQLIEYDLQVLEDDLQLFPPYQGAPLLREETLKKHPELEGVLTKLANKISSETMAKMNYQVDVEKQSAYQVAYNYLTEIGLLK